MEHKIISVPHSGTRSLKEVLIAKGVRFNEPKWRRKPLDECRVPESPFLHFDEDSDIIQAFDGIAHIPLRWPYDILRSWESRRRHHGRCGMWMIDSIREMIEWTKDRPNVVFYNCYQLPVIKGEYRKQHLSEHKFEKTELWQAYCEFSKNYPVEEFYRERISGL